MVVKEPTYKTCALNAINNGKVAARHLTRLRAAISRLTRWDRDVEQYLLQGAEDVAVRLSVAMATNTLRT